MREIKVKEYIKQDKKWSYFALTSKEDERLCESIGLIDQNGQDLYVNDLVIIENNLFSKQFRIVFNQSQLAYGFQREDETRDFYTLSQIKGIFENYTITKVGNIFN